MRLYSVALFLHVVGAMLLFITLTVEGITLRYLRRATTADQVQVWGSVAGLTGVIGPISAILVIVPGLYMLATTWGWVAWIATGLVGWLLIVVLGTFIGIRLNRGARTAAGQGLTGRSLEASLGYPLLLALWQTLVAMALGIVFLMTVKPAGGLPALVLVVAAAIGLASGVPQLRRTRSQNTANKESLT